MLLFLFVSLISFTEFQSKQQLFGVRVSAFFFFFIEMPLFVVRVLRKSFWRPPTQRAAISHSK